jgi:COP9 signalosome complex subunit 8
MSQAPPTPPPTSTTELMDQEKDAAATAVPVAMQAAVIPAAPPAAAPAVAPVPAGAGGTGALDHYHRLLPTLVDFVAQRNYLEVIRVAELADLKVRAPSAKHRCSDSLTRMIQAEGDERPSRLALTVPLVLSYLIQDEP